jgi:hypothetical protein
MLVVIASPMLAAVAKTISAFCMTQLLQLTYTTAAAPQ